MTGNAPQLSIALLHHPVLNKTGEMIGSAVTNLDLHDISRAARTYGVSDFFVATPYEDQRVLINEIVDHWQNGHGASANPARKEALAIVRPVMDLQEIMEALSDKYGTKPLVIATSARPQPKEISFTELRHNLNGNKSPVLLIFGTAHGLAPEIIDQADGVLPPIGAKSDYNHLSVRSAVSIILDRLASKDNN